MIDISGRTTIVVGASRGLGRGIAVAFAAAASILDRYEPEALILVAGATPLMRPLQHQTSDTFSVNWHSDVRIAFQWVREVLLKPLRPGSRVVVVSSGAVLAGSLLSGGYAGAKSTQRFIVELRAGRGATRRSRHNLHGCTASAHAAYRVGSTGCPGVRRSFGSVRGRLPQIVRQAAHAGGRRRSSGRTCAERPRQHRPRIPADRGRTAAAARLKSVMYEWRYK